MHDAIKEININNKLIRKVYEILQRYTTDGVKLKAEE